MEAGRRERTKAQNRETILAAAGAVFSQLGFAAATVRDIIRATPLASGTFYNYFKSKEEVYQALRDTLALEIRPALREARRSAATAEEFLAGGFRLFFELAAGRRRDAPAVEASRLRMDSPEVLEGFEELKSDIQDAMGRGVLPVLDAELLAAAIAGLAFELAAKVKAGTDSHAATQFATALLLTGLSGPGAPA